MTASLYQREDAGRVSRNEFAASPLPGRTGGATPMLAERSAGWTRGRGSPPLRIGLGRELIGPAAGPVVLGHARPHPLASRLERAENLVLVGAEHATRLHDEAA